MIRTAWRALIAQPAVSAGIMLSLALAVGANTTIFGLADEILWKPLPIRAPEKVVAVYGVRTTSAGYLSSSHPDYVDYRDGSAGVFSALAAYLRVQVRLERGRSAEPVAAEFVSASYFDAVGVTPLQGRTFVAEDESAVQPVALVSERLWRRQIGAGSDRGAFDGGALGDAIVINGVAVTVIGVVPASYKGVLLDWTDPPDVWMPLPLIEQTHTFIRASGMFTRRDARGFMIVGRLRDGVARGEAEAALRTIAARLETAHPDSNAGVTATVLPVRDARFWPGHRPTVTRTLFVFAGAVALVLLLACTNIANLLLERAAARRKEIAVRLALGATRASLVRQLMTESVLLALGGALAGLAVARVLSTALASATQLFGVRLALDLALDLRVLAFTVALAFITAVLFGLMPALRASKSDLASALKGTHGTAQAGFGLFSLRHGLVIAQVAMSLLLLACGALFARSLYESYQVDPGFRRDGLLVVPIDLSGRNDTGGRNHTLVQQAIDRIAALPGVEAVTMAQGSQFGPTRTRLTLTADRASIDQRASAGSPLAPATIDYRDVGAGYFRTLGIPMIAGRDIETRDLAVEMKTVVVNDTLARQLWGTAPALGRSIRSVAPNGQTIDTWEVVGVARTTKYRSLWEAPVPMLYRPMRRERLVGGTLLIRTTAAAWSTGSSAASSPLTRAVREIARSFDPMLPPPPIKTWADQIAESVAPQRMAASLLGLFSVSALVLASVGLYSVLAYAVAQRTREIGLRIALGAEPSRVLRQVVGRGLLLAAIGLTIGLGAAALVGPLVAALAPGVTMMDPIAVGSVSAVLLIVAALASIRPARRAARVDPLVAIRSE